MYLECALLARRQRFPRDQYGKTAIAGYLHLCGGGDVSFQQLCSVPDGEGNRLAEFNAVSIASLEIGKNCGTNVVGFKDQRRRIEVLVAEEVCCLSRTREGIVQADAKSEEPAVRLAYQNDCQQTRTPAAPGLLVRAGLTQRCVIEQQGKDETDKKPTHTAQSKSSRQEVLHQ